MPISPLRYNRYSLGVHEYMVHPQLLRILLRMSLLHIHTPRVYAFRSRDNQQRNVTL